eukprot:6211207-Pleurochrysis_carterae.AAC.2
MIIDIRYQLAMVWERARARGLGAPTGVAPVEQGAQRAAAAMRERGIQSLGDGARALRKYACDATETWETMHVSVNCQTATKGNSFRGRTALKGKKVIHRSRVQNAK